MKYAKVKYYQKQNYFDQRLDFVSIINAPHVILANILEEPADFWV